MRVALQVRFLDFNTQADEGTFQTHARRALYSRRGQLHHDEDVSWSLRDLEQDTYQDAYSYHVYVGTDRTAITDDTGDLTETELREYEQIRHLLFLDRLMLAVVEPSPKTQERSPKQLTDLSVGLLGRFFERAELPAPTFRRPEGTRAKVWFVRRLLEAADSPRQRITSMSITNLHGSQLTDQFDLFNPDVDWEAIGRAFLPRANEEVAKSAHNATPQGDLSHNPLVRGQLNAGTPQSMTIKVQPEGGGREESRSYGREVSDTGKVRVPSDPRVRDYFRAILILFDSGAFDVE